MSTTHKAALYTLHDSSNQMNLQDKDRIEIDAVRHCADLADAVSRLRDDKGLALVDGPSLLAALTRKASDRPREASGLLTAETLHDLRHLLVVIRGYSEVLLRMPQSSEKAQAYVDRIFRSSCDMQVLLEELLTLANPGTERLPLHLSVVRLSEERNTVFEAHELHALRKGLAFEVRLIGTPPVDIRTDALRLRRMIGNLISNAIKFTERGSVRVEMAHAAGMLDITVSDTGPGIPKECQATIFEPFEQATSKEAASDSPGVGLGLSSVRRMARLMGGDVVLERSEPDKGSVFRLNIPAEGKPAE